MSVEPSSTSRTRGGGNKEGKNASEEVAGNFGDGERFDLIIVGESKSEQVRPSSSGCGVVGSLTGRYAVNER